MAHTINGRKKLLTPIRRIQGQAAAIERAADQEADCRAILQQIAAVRGAVNGLMAEVLEGHMREHLGAPGFERGATCRRDGRAGGRHQVVSQEKCTG